MNLVWSYGSQGDITVLVVTSQACIWSRFEGQGLQPPSPHGGHNNVRLAAAAPENGLKIVATPNLALSEIFILYKDRLQLHLSEIEDDLCIV